VKTAQSSSLASRLQQKLYYDGGCLPCPFGLHPEGIGTVPQGVMMKYCPSFDLTRSKVVYTGFRGNIKETLLAREPCFKKCSYGLQENRVRKKNAEYRATLQ